MLHGNDQLPSSDTRWSHRDVLQELADAWHLEYAYLRSIMPARREYEDLSFLETLAGKYPEPTGAWNCRECGSNIGTPACSRFVERVRRVFKREIRDEYVEPHCPECGEMVERRRPYERHVRSDDPQPVVWDEEATPDMTTDMSFDTEEYMQYQPCGCLFDPDDARVKWDLDRDRMEREEPGGIGYDGPITTR